MFPNGLPSEFPPTQADDEFAALYRQHYRRVVSLCRRLLGGHHDAEAVAQEAFIRAWTSWGTYASHRDFWPWVATIARRLAINEIHALNRRDHLSRRAARLSAPSFAGTVHEDRIVDSQCIRRVLRTLSPRHQRLLRLRDLEGWSYDDIAVFEGTTVEAVRGSLKRARAAFRRAFEDMAERSLVGLSLGYRLLAWARERMAAVAQAVGVPARSVPAEWMAAFIAVASLVQVSTPAPRPMGADAAAPAGQAVATTVALGVPAPAPATSTTTARRVPPPAAPAAAPLGRERVRRLDGSSYEFTASPNYERDRTVFARGGGRTCDQLATACRELYKSDDGGRTWVKLRADGYRGWPLLLPPNYPADPRIFTSSGAALSVSDDGGETFREVGLVVGVATMTPDFSAASPRLLFGAPTRDMPVASEYNIETKELRPLSLPLPAGVVPMRFSFGPTYAADGRMLVTAYDHTRISGGSGVFSCDRASCQPVVYGNSTVPLRVTWTGGRKATALVSDTFAVYRSYDGVAFEKLDLPGGGQSVVDEAVVGLDGRIWVSTRGSGVDDVGLYTSRDGGATWERVEPGMPVSNVTVLPDGTVLASLAWTHGTGIRCSVDGGTSWADSCEDARI